MSQCTRLTDGQTDGQTDGRTDRIPIARPRLHSMQRGKNVAMHQNTVYALFLFYYCRTVKKTKNMKMTIMMMRLMRMKMIMKMLLLTLTLTMTNTVKATLLMN